MIERIRRWWFIVAVGLVWVVLVVIQITFGIDQPKPGTDVLGQLFSPLSRLMTPLRSGLLAASQTLPSVGGELMPGLSIGDTSRVSQSLSDAMKAVSLTHLVAVSGANCHIVTASTFGLLSWVGAPRWIRIGGAAAVLVLFVAVVTPGASITRAAVMSLSVLIGLALGRLSAGLPVLALATLLLLIVEPAWATNYGFVLSVLATLGLLTITTPVQRLLSAWMHPGLALALAVPISATLLCQPVIILLSPKLPTYGILANLLAVPAAGIVTVVGLLACLSSLVFMPAAVVLSWLAWIPSEWIGRVATSLAALPFSQLEWPPGVIGLAVAGVVSACVIVVAIRRTSRVRRVSILVASGLLASSLLWTVGSAQHAVAAIPVNWRITACDVGQGDALVLKGLDASGKAHFALVDTGRTPVKLRECLARLHITHLDLMVLTHYDLDHVGGVSAATGMVERVLMQKPAGFADDRLRSEVCSGHTACENGQAGLSGILGDASWQVIWPDGRTPEMQEGNPGSISMVVRWPEFAAAFVGDLGAAAQDQLLATTLDVPQVDVLKVAHHGSADTSARLVERFNPRIALVSVGVDNGYGHPTRKALGMLEALGTVIGRTDKQGFLFVSVTSGALRLDTDR